MFHLVKDEIKSINSGSPDDAKCVDVIVPEPHYQSSFKQCITASLEQLNKPYRIWVWDGAKLTRDVVYPTSLKVDSDDKLFLLFACKKSNSPIPFGNDGAFPGIIQCMAAGKTFINKKRVKINKGSEESYSLENCRILVAFFADMKGSLYLHQGDVSGHSDPDKFDIFFVNEEEIKQRLKSQKNQNLFKPKSKKQQTEDQLRAELIFELEKYIDKIFGYLNTKEGFAHGFWVDKKDRAINREINYHLAKSLLDKLEAKPKQPLASVFADIQAQRKDVLTALSKKGGSGDFKKFSNKDVHSSTLKAIIKKAKDFIKQPSPKKPQKT